MKRKAYRNDSYAKVTGRALYADDFNFLNQLFCVPVYSGYIHAAINDIYIDEAEKMPGVVKVITWKDVPGKIKYGQIFQDYYILAQDKIRFEGDVIALIVAESTKQALAAVPFVKVDAEELTSVLSPEQGVQEGCPLVHKELKNNIICHHKVRRGDFEKGLKESDFIIEQEFKTSFLNMPTLKLKVPYVCRKETVQLRSTEVSSIRSAPEDLLPLI